MVKPVESIYVQNFGTTRQRIWHQCKKLPTSEYDVLKEPLQGYAVISLSDLFNKNDDFSWLRRKNPVDRIGYSMWVYDLGAIKKASQ
jgi:hypothetical protein